MRYALHRKRCNRGSDTLTPTKFGGYSNRKTAFGLKKKTLKSKNVDFFFEISDTYRI